VGHAGIPSNTLEQQFNIAEEWFACHYCHWYNKFCFIIVSTTSYWNDAGGQYSTKSLSQNYPPVYSYAARQMYQSKV